MLASSCVAYNQSNESNSSVKKWWNKAPVDQWEYLSIGVPIFRPNALRVGVVQLQDHTSRSSRFICSICMCVGLIQFSANRIYWNNIGVFTFSISLHSCRCMPTDAKSLKLQPTWKKQRFLPHFGITTDVFLSKSGNLFSVRAMAFIGEKHSILLSVIWQRKSNGLELTAADFFNPNQPFIVNKNIEK